MKKTVFSVMVVFAVMFIFACSVWAEGTPQVTFKGTVMIFPKEDKVPDCDLSQFEIGKGLENVPTEYSKLVGNVYRADWNNNINSAISRIAGSSPVWYIFLAGYSNKDIEFIVNASSFRATFIIVCPDDNSIGGFDCYIKNPKGIQSFNRYKISLKKGLPFINQLNGYGEFYPAGDLPEEIWKK